LPGSLRAGRRAGSAADEKARLRSLKDLDQADSTLASACQMLLDMKLPDVELRTRLFERILKTSDTAVGAPRFRRTIQDY